MKEISMPNENVSPEALKHLLYDYFRQNECLQISKAEPISKQLQHFANDKELKVDVPEDEMILFTKLWDMVIKQIIEPYPTTSDGGGNSPQVIGVRRTKYGEKILHGLLPERDYQDYLKLKRLRFGSVLLIAISTTFLVSSILWLISALATPHGNNLLKYDWISVICATISYACFAPGIILLSIWGLVREKVVGKVFVVTVILIGILGSVLKIIKSFAY